MNTLALTLALSIVVWLPLRAHATVRPAIHVLSVHPNPARLGDQVTVKVSHPEVLNSDSVRGALLMFIDGIPLRGLPADSQLYFDGSAKFILERKDIDSNVWKAFYHNPRASEIQNLSVTIGHLNGLIATPLNNWKFTVVDDRSLYAGIGVAVLFAFGLVWLAGRHGLLKDSGSGVYSLSRSQFAFWTVVVLASFLYIWFVMGNLPELGTNTLLLLAITTATSAGVALQDSRPNELSVVPVTYNGSRWKFLLDILSDETGLSVHRLQMVIWTLGLAAVYVSGAIVNLRLPELSATLLGLMRISAAGYVGLRSLEGTNTTASPIMAAPRVTAAPLPSIGRSIPHDPSPATATLAVDDQSQDAN